MLTIGKQKGWISTLYPDNDATQMMGSTFTISPEGNHRILIGQDNLRKYRAMTIAHELAHLLDGLYDGLPRRTDIETIFGIVTSERVRAEYKAWAVAKSIVKPSEWHEDEALRCFNRYRIAAGMDPVTEIVECNDIHNNKGGKNNGKR